MSWITPGSNRDDVLGLLPELAEPFDQLYRSLWQLPQLPASTLELCRLRLALLHRCDVEWQRECTPVSAGKKARLPHWPTAEEFSPEERACLEFTETYAMDVQAITDEQADAVKLHYGEPGLVALVEALGILDGMTRLSLLWQLSADEHSEGKL